MRDETVGDSGSNGKTTTDAPPVKQREHGSQVAALGCAYHYRSVRLRKGLDNRCEKPGDDGGFPVKHFELLSLFPVVVAVGVPGRVSIYLIPPRGKEKPEVAAKP